MMQFLLVVWLANHTSDNARNYTAQVVTVQTATLQGCLDAYKAVRKTTRELEVIRSSCTRINP